MAKIMTVLGPISPNELGFTLMHEHIIHLGYYRLPRVQALDEVDVAINELKLFKEAGGSAIVEVTPRDLRLDTLPLGYGEALRRISEQSGIHIVACTGYYLDDTYPPSIIFHEKGIKELAEDMVRDIVDGIDNSGVKAGIIGEIGARDEHPTAPRLTANEEKVFHAAARVHKATGLPITTHQMSAGNLSDQFLDLFEEEEISLDKVIIGHLDQGIGRIDDPWYGGAEGNLARALRLAKRGCYLEYDLIGGEENYPYGTATKQDRRRIIVITELIRAGFLEQILFSQDTDRKSVLHKYGGKGYDHLLRHFVPLLRESGITDEQIHTITVENPRRVLSY